MTMTRLATGPDRSTNSSSADWEATGGNDVIVTSDINSASYRGGPGNDTFFTGNVDVELRQDIAGL